MNDTSLKAATWALIEKRADETVRRQHPTLTKHQANDAFLKTEEGAGLLAVYQDPDARLDAAGYVAKKKERALFEDLGYPSAEHAVTDAAKTFAAARPDAAAHSAEENMHYGFGMVGKHLPHLRAAAEAERGR